MNGKKRLLCLVLFVLLVASCFAFSAIADDGIVFLGSKEVVDAMLAEYTEDAALEEKLTVLTGIKEYLDETPVDPATEGYAELETRIKAYSLECAVALCDNIDYEQTNIAEFGVTVRKASSFVKNAMFDVESEGYIAMKTELDAAYAEYDARKAAARAALIDYNTALDYCYNTFFRNEYEKDGGDQLRVANNSGGNVKAPTGRETGDDGDNGYYSVHYVKFPAGSPSLTVTEPDGGGVKHTYACIDYPEVYEEGTVVEFDITTFGKAPTGAIQAEHGSTKVEDGAKTIGPYFLQFKPNGDFASDKDTILVENAMIKDEWFHVTIIINQDTLMIDYYGDYQYLGTYKMPASQSYVFDIIYFRIAAQPSGNTPGTEFSLDNVRAYAGDKIRDIDYLDSFAKTEDKFKFLASGLNVGGADFMAYKVCYDKLSVLLPNFYNVSTGEYLTAGSLDPEALKAAVDTYLNFDYQSILDQYKLIMRDQYIELINKALSMQRKPGTLSDRKKAQTAVDDFFSKNNAYILMDQIYTEAATKYSTFSDQIASEDNINIFVNSVTGFFKVSGATGKQQQYDSATKLINAGLELALLEDENYFDFAEAYETYFTLPPLLVDAWTIDRTERFISAVTYILKYDDKIEWVTNEAQIRPYVEMAREIYNEGIDIYYSNAKELYDAFSEIDNFYYEKLQTEHIAYINECFARFEKATIYVEKIGICDDIARYFESGTVDFSNEEIKALYDKYLDTRASIEGDLENYNALLEMNMNLFVAEMAKLDGAVTFAEKTAVYNAATRYVNSMSLSTEAAVEAKVVYEELGEYIKEATKVAENFVNSVMLLATIEDDDAMYYALVACYRELQNVNVEVDGAYDAKLAFEATLDNYNYTVYSANSDVEKSQDCVLSCDSCGNSVAVIISYYLFK